MKSRQEKNEMLIHQICQLRSFFIAVALFLSLLLSCSERNSYESIDYHEFKTLVESSNLGRCEFVSTPERNFVFRVELVDADPKVTSKRKIETTASSSQEYSELANTFAQKCTGLTIKSSP